MEITYKKADTADAELLIEIYNAAFYGDYVRYGECPAYGRTKERMELSIKSFPKYIICLDGRSVGVLSFKNKGNGNYYLGCLCVLPEYQRRGIGTNAMTFMKSVCPSWREIELVTPADKEENLHFYIDRCGFKLGGKSMDGNVEVVNIFDRR